MRPLSGNISDKIMPESKHPSRHHCGYQHLKNLKDITLHHSGFSEKFCKWEILSLNTYRWGQFQAIYQTK